MTANAHPGDHRQRHYTTSAIEALHRQRRKSKGHFPNEDAARKLIYLAIHNAVPRLDSNLAALVSSAPGRGCRAKG